jgi:PAS domain S-box-containing protein
MERDDVAGLGFLRGGGAMGAAIRALDWAASDLGHPKTWPQPLRSVVELVLQSKFPMFVAWGGRLLFIYNDACAEILGSKHPDALGAPFHEIWSEVWPDISPLIASAVAGEATYSEDLPLVMNRRGFDEQTWFTFSYSPVRDESGRVAGLYCAVTETTHKVLAERRTNRDLSRMVQLFDQAPGLICVLYGPDHVFEFGNAALSALFGERDWIGRPARQALPEIEGQGFFELLDKVYATGERQIAPGMRASLRGPLDPAPREVIIDVIFAPLTDETGAIAGVFCQGQDVTDRKLVEQALRGSERQLAKELADARALQAISTRLILEQRPQALYDHMIDAAMQVMKSDAAAIQIFDAEAAALRVVAWKNFPREAVEHWMIVKPGGVSACSQAFANKERVAFEDVESVAVLAGTKDLEAYRRSGIRAVQSTPLFSRSGRLLGMMSTFWRDPNQPSSREYRFFDVLARQAADLIERLEAEAALKDSEEQLRLATEAADIGLWDVDLVTDTLYWPPRVKAMFGISADAPVSMADFYAGLHPADRDFVSAEYVAAANPEVRSLYDVEYRTIGKEDGIERWVAAKGRGVFNDDGRCIRMIGVAIDVTERKAAEARLRELNDTLEQRVAAAVAERNILADIVEGTDAFVQVADLDYRLLAINKAATEEFERIFGVRLHVGESMLDLLADQPEQRAVLKRIWSRALAGEEFTETAELGIPSRDRRFYEMKFNVLRDHNGKTIGAYQFVHDVTERLRNEARLKEAETGLRHAQKMEAIGQLTGGVSHDFNNLLMAISGGLRLIERPLDASKRERVLSGMRKAVERGASLTRQLLAFSRRRPLASEPINLTTQIAGMREFLDRSLGGDVQIATHLPEDLWTIEADAGELELAILNLCVNARDAMPNGGIIMIDAHNLVEGPADGSREAVELCVADSGVGMTEDVIARACEPFFTTKEIGKGSGLGLSQVYAFVTSSGGALSIESKPDMGTTVRLRFPRSAQALAAASEERAAPAPAAVAERKRGHVLLVEDDREVAILSREMLSSIGFDVTHAASAEAALGALKNGRRIDIVFSDVRMPGGMSGVDLAREIRRRNPRLPVVLTTGYAEGMSDAEREGIPVLPKPYQLEALSDVLTRHLR